MNSKQIAKFKEEMKYYVWLKDTVNRLQNKADDMLYCMTGVRGISYDKTINSINEQLANEKKLDMIDSFEKITNKLNHYKERLDYVDNILKAMNEYERNMFLLKYEEGLTFQQIANQYYISKAGLFYRMQKALERI